MRHRKRTAKLGVKSDHRFAMMRNMTLGLLEHGRIKTTVARAKLLRTFIEPLVTRLKDPSLANIRLANQRLHNRDAALKIAREISPVFAKRPGGYTRILKLAGHRAGDAADMALIEWVEESLVPAYAEVASPGAKKTAKKPTAAKKAAGKKAASKSKKAAADGEAATEAKPAKKKTASKAK
jgi:large subunit ribosomal protein L17